jgi:hypothetical protein
MPMGLLLNAFFGLRWADPVAALIMVPIIAKEGIEGVRGIACNDCCSVQSELLGGTVDSAGLPFDVGQLESRRLTF